MCSAYGTHKDHRCIPVVDYVETCRQELNGGIELLTKQSNQLIEAKANVDRILEKTVQIHEEFNSNVQRSVSEMMTILLDKQKELIDTSNNIKETKGTSRVLFWGY